MQFTSAIAAIACVVFAISTASAQSVDAYTKFSDCAVNSSELSIKSLSLSPSPMCLGQDYCLTATGTLSQPIVKGAKLGVWGKYLNRIVYTDKVDLCDVLAANSQNCPIAATTDVTTQFDFIATNTDNETIFCQRALDRGLEGATC
ncbi:hypothetical protein BGW39_002490 [Mortierella sp. 14UC]|nr:hypothetical protein BGW39_002490 [Mortierella sp. 14UC]